VSPYRVYLCGAGDSPVEDPNPTCPNASEHTPVPRGYLDWHEWAEEKAKTHTPKQCPGCGRWLLHEPIRKTARGKDR
jgi:hypothetical protein